MLRPFGAALLFRATPGGFGEVIPLDRACDCLLDLRLSATLRFPPKISSALPRSWANASIGGQRATFPLDDHGRFPRIVRQAPAPRSSLGHGRITVLHPRAAFEITDTGTGWHRPAPMIAELGFGPSTSLAKLFACLLPDGRSTVALLKSAGWGARKASYRLPRKLRNLAAARSAISPT